MHAAALLLLASLVDSMPKTPAAPPLQGRYGLLMDVGARVELPGVGPLDATYRSLLIVDVQTKADGKTVQKHRTCDVQLDEDMPLVQVVVPPAAVQALKARTDPVTLGDDGETYRADMGRRDIGFVSSTGRMPQNGDDASIVDPDGDGAPGVTLKLNLPVGGLDVHYVQRDHAVLHGRVLSPDLVEGAIEVRALEQNVLSTSPSLPDPKVSITPKRDQSTFKLFRIAPDASCGELVSTWRQKLADAQQARGAAGEAVARQP
jgi:hypothetical protein